MIVSLTDEQLNQNLKEIEQERARLEVLKSYRGDDEVVLVSELQEELKQVVKPPRIRSGIHGLDNIVDGFQRGELVVVTGPTGQGKTTLLQTLTIGFAERGINALWLSYEVGVEDLIERFGINVPTFSLPKRIQPSRLDWLEQKIWEGIAKYGTKVVFVDHLHFLLEMAGLANVNTSLAIGALMRELKLMALRTKTTIFLVSHLKKTRLEDTPSIDDLRDSSFVAQESDMVFLVWRKRDTDDNGMEVYTNKTYLKVDKNRRKGTLGYITLEFDGFRLQEVKNDRA